MNRFQKNPKKTIFATVIILVVLIDLSAGKLLIEENDHPFRIPHYYYHHDLLPNTEAMDSWGNQTYKLFTNSLGFRDREIRDVPLVNSKKRTLFIGDSFTEAVGAPYEKSFVGLLEEEVDTATMELLNAAVISYSPKLYYLKVKYLLEEVGLQFNDLFVFIDISDPHDEVIYHDYQPGKFRWRLNQLRKFIRSRSFLAYSFNKMMRERINYWGHDVNLADLDYPADSLPYWTLNDDSYEKLGRRGLGHADKHMQQLVELCRERDIHVSIAVYPWPEQILFNDLNSVQVTFWKEFCEKNEVRFINLFPEFIKPGRNADVIVKQYYIEGDMHWNQAGHRLVADGVFKYLSP